jgi:pilus assembly protein Flp/PilA
MYLISRLRALVRDDSGQDLIEYGLLATLIAVAAIAALTAGGVQINTMWTTISTALLGVNS